MIKTKNQYINREISWLRFNERVLQECEDENVPLIERLRFLGIFSNNLDEFFKVRYATVKRIVDAGKTGKSVLGGERAKDLLEEITKIVIDQQMKSVEVLKKVEQELEEQDIFLLNEKELSEEQGVFVKQYFIEKVSPQLMTIILDDYTKFPMLKDTAAYLAVKMVLRSDDRTKRTYEKREKRYALIEIPKGIDRFVVLPKEGNKNYILILDDVIRYCLDSVFTMFDYKSISAHMIKITRDAELDIDNDLSKSFIEKIYSSVEHRKISDPVRFVYDNCIEKDTLDFLKGKMEVEETDSVIPGGKYHNKRDYMGFPSLGRHDLMYEKIVPLPVNGLHLEGSLLEKIAEKDYLQYT
ncbi:MAG: polyphosphate kinase 1, partial [Pricia sp.]|nr:polyphosphate kinase 1 [Pricia sp.]